MALPGLQQEANNPATSGARLHELAAHQELLPLIARNPNAPPELLVQIIFQHPREVLENPALSILVLENPSFFETLPDTALLALVEQPEAPTEVVSVALRRQSWLFDDKIAAHPKTPPEVLAKMSRSERATLRVIAGRNPATPADALRRLGQDARPEVRWAAAENPSTPPETLALLLRDPTMGARFRVAKNASALPDLLGALAADSAWEVRLQVAQHPNTPEDTRRQLSHDEDERVRAAAHAPRPRLSDQTQME